MLTRIVLLNSGTYAKADLELGDADSIQIVGPNNIGKSTLIYALNFLYIIHRSHMSFSGHRTGDKATVHHYFPDIGRSYMVFEVIKGRYFCILIHRKPDDTLQYLKIDSAYREDIFFETTPTGEKKLLPIEGVQSRLLTEGIDNEAFDTLKKMFSFAYKQGRKNNCVVWLNEKGSTDARETQNNFTEIYRFLIDPKRIKQDSLKKSLIIADKKDGEFVSFTRDQQAKIQELRQQQDRLKTLEQVREDYNTFLELLDSYEEVQHLLFSKANDFHRAYPAALGQLQVESEALQQQMRDNKDELDVLEAGLSTLYQEIGGLNQNIEHVKGDLKSLTDAVREIQGLEGRPFLEQGLFKLDEERQRIEYQLSQIKDHDLDEGRCMESIEKIDHELEKLQSRIDTYSGQLIHQLAARPSDRDQLHALLSEFLSSLPAEHLLKPVTGLGPEMTLFDGLIRLPDHIPVKPIPSIEELSDKRDRLRKDRVRLDGLLGVARNLHTFREKSRSVHQQILEVQGKLDRIDTLPEMQRQLEDKGKKAKFLELSLTDKETQLDRRREEIRKKKDGLEDLKQQYYGCLKRVHNLRQWKSDIESIPGLSLDNFPDRPDYPTEDLSSLFTAIQHHRTKRDELKKKKDQRFDDLKGRIRIPLGSEEDFRQHMDSELATLQDQRNSIEKLLQNISLQFSMPCRKLLDRFKEHEQFIKNRFNAQLRKIRISDIDSLHIEVHPAQQQIKELEKISAIRTLSSELMFEDQTGVLETLNRYLQEERRVEFGDLFDIRIHLDHKGRQRHIQMDGQIESDGTDRMIRLVLIMSIIHQLVIPDADNRIIVFIDEIGTLDEANRMELLRFCREHHFLPITAAPLNPFDGFDRYYIILPNKNGKIVVGKQNRIIMQRKHPNREPD
jgi:hypothetical protein